MNLKNQKKTSALSEVCWYTNNSEPPFTHDLIDVNVCELDNFKFIDLLKNYFRLF